MNLTKVSLSLPFNLGSAKWEPDAAERRAAWSLYVELVTHSAVAPLEGDEGLLHETRSSLRSLFATTREILREAGLGGAGPRASRLAVSPLRCSTTASARCSSCGTRASRGYIRDPYLCRFGHKHRSRI
jgi:hypothetical protein